MARRDRSMPSGPQPKTHGSNCQSPAHPPVGASRRRCVTRGILVHEFDVRRQPGPSEDSFEQVVAQQGVFGNSARERRLERVDIVNALADIRPLAAQVLVHVGYGGRIRVDAAGAGNEALVARAVVTKRQRRRDSWLQHRVTLDDSPAVLVKARRIQGVPHLADQPAHGVSRQPRIGIERDHIAHAGRNGGRLAADGQEARVDGAAQQAIQFVQLAALALPTHPDALRFVPQPSPMQEQEAIARRTGTVLEVQARGCPRPHARAAPRPLRPVRTPHRPSPTSSAKLTSPSRLARW